MKIQSFFFLTIQIYCQKIKFRKKPKTIDILYKICYNIIKEKGSGRLNVWRYVIKRKEPTASQIKKYFGGIKI